MIIESTGEFYNQSLLVYSSSALLSFAVVATCTWLIGLPVLWTFTPLILWLSRSYLQVSRSVAMAHDASAYNYDNIGESVAWCNAVNPSCTEIVDDVELRFLPGALRGPSGERLSATRPVTRYGPRLSYLVILPIAHYT